MRIYLRNTTELDAINIVRWRNSEKVRNHCFDKRLISVESHLDFYRNYILTGKYRQFIVERIEQQTGVASYPIGVISLKDMDEYNNRCELCIFTSDDEEWNSESQALALNLILDKAFNEYKMHKIYTYVFCAFFDEIDLLESVGFVKEALFVNEAKNSEGKYVDVSRYSMTKELFERIRKS